MPHQLSQCHGHVPQAESEQAVCSERVAVLQRQLLASEEALAEAKRGAHAQLAEVGWSLGGGCVVWTRFYRLARQPES
jgi:hypothetical protein